MTNQIFAGLGRSRLPWATFIVTASFLLGAWLTFHSFASSKEYDYIRQSRLLAESIRAAGFPGPVAAAAKGDSGMKHPAIYTSFFLDQPYHGTQDATTEAEVLESRARLIVVARFSSQDQLLTSSSMFLDLDDKLFGAMEKVRMPGYRLFLNLDYGRNG